MNYKEFKHHTLDKLNETFNKDEVYLNKGKTTGGFTYEKRIGNRILVIPCSISKYNDKFICRSIGAGIIFLEIEEIFAPLVAKNELMSSDLKATDNATIGINRIPQFRTIDFTKFRNDIEIVDESGIEILVEKITEMYFQFASPAFASFTSIEQFVPIIENMTPLEINDYFGFGSMFKKMILYRLCNHTDYEKYMTERIKAFESVIATKQYDVDTPKWYTTVIELKEILDNTAPKYNV